MNQTNVTVSAGVLTLTSSLANSPEGNSSKSPNLTIRYNSGTFYLKQQITISKQFPMWDISGQFKVPTQKGTWPAFWMTGANSWPPESDFMEFKGSAGCNQNTYNGSWQGKITTVSSAGTAWHAYRVVATLENSTNVDFHYYIDGILETEQTSTTFVDSPCWLIIDYQMEGSSGVPGPSSTTFCSMTNIVVKRENVSPSAASIDQWSAGSTTQPQINQISISGTNLVLTTSTGISRVNYSVLNSLDFTPSASGWTPVATIMSDRSGNYAFTNGMALNMPQYFFLLQLQPASARAASSGNLKL